MVFMTLSTRPTQTPRGGQHPHDWIISSKHLHIPKTLPEVPDQQIFRDALIPYPLQPGKENLPNIQQYPTNGHVAVHLCLLEVFGQLKDEIDSGLAYQTVLPQKSTNDNELPTYAEAEEQLRSDVLSPQWQNFIKAASLRYEIWFENLESIIKHAAAYNRYGTGSHTHGAFTENYLPPLDVLLIWYLHMLRPDTYLERCRLNGYNRVLEICFPWDALNKAIDLKTMRYKITGAAALLFTKFTGLDVDWTTGSMMNVSQTIEKDDLAFEEVMNVQDMFFLQQMHELLWIRSPSAEGTIDRASTKYKNLVTRSHVSSWATDHQILTDPSLNIMWRTHKLYPNAYLLRRDQTEQNFSTAKPIDHDMKLRLECDGGNEKEVDIENCYCWTCERLRDAITEAGKPNMSVSSTNVLSVLSMKTIQAVLKDVTLHRQIEAVRETVKVGSSPPSYRRVKTKKLREKLTGTT